ncbi:MAG: hypothetical protein R2795_06310 [Saprospiraceae bacterium]
MNAPLLIQHARIRDTYADNIPIPIRVFAFHESGIQAVQCHYRLLPDTTFQPLPLAASDAGEWVGNLPPFASGSQVQYYLQATAYNGTTSQRPLPAPVAFYDFEVKSYNTPPQADWRQTAFEVAPLTRIRFTDVSEAGQARYWSFPGGTPVLATQADVSVTYPQPGNTMCACAASTPKAAIPCCVWPPFGYSRLTSLLPLLLMRGFPLGGNAIPHPATPSPGNGRKWKDAAVLACAYPIGLHLESSTEPSCARPSTSATQTKPLCASMWLMLSGMKVTSMS